jgi:hypothetical protein
LNELFIIKKSFDSIKKNTRKLFKKKTAERILLNWGKNF